MKPLYLTYIALLTLLFSCGGEKQQPSMPQPAPEPEKVIEYNTLVISSFDSIPDEISGCGCAFASDSLTYKAGNYIFADDIGEIAYMKINGKMVRLTQSKSAAKQTDTTATDTTTVDAHYKADGIEVILKAQKGKDINYEVWQASGKIIIKQADGQSINRVVYGSCGC